MEGYYDGAGIMKSVKNNQNGIAPMTDVEDIVVELHNASPPHAMVASANAILKTNGTATCRFSSADSGSYYIAVKTKSGIQTWSKTPQAVGNTLLSYDFSTAANKAFGDNMKNLGSGVFGFYSGDINQDESIDSSDAPDLFDAIDASEFGIQVTDLNGDGSVDNTDVPFFSDNADSSIYSIHP